MSALVLKLHYLLWFGSLGGVLPYTSVFGRHHSLASATEIGLLYTLLPFTVIFAKPIFCWISDRFVCHKLVLVTAMIMTLLGYGCLIITPFLDFKSFWFYSVCVFVANTAMGVVTSMTDSIVMKEVSLGRNSFGSIRVFGTLGFGCFGLIAGVINELEAFTRQLPYLVPGLVMFIVVLCLDIIFILVKLPDSSCSVESSREDVVHPCHENASVKTRRRECHEMSHDDNLRNESDHHFAVTRNSCCCSTHASVWPHHRHHNEKDNSDDHFVGTCHDSNARCRDESITSKPLETAASSSSCHDRHYRRRDFHQNCSVSSSSLKIILFMKLEVILQIQSWLLLSLSLIQLIMALVFL